ncbi:hypothetical protein DM01DRAFT_1287471, partial [Hesseltinella vesiculosa]
IDMLSYLMATKKNVCLVCLDFAGISTNPVDLSKLFSKHQLKIFERQNVVKDPLALQEFDCRKQLVQRSK